MSIPAEDGYALMSMVMESGGSGRRMRHLLAVSTSLALEYQLPFCSVAEEPRSDTPTRYGVDRMDQRTVNLCNCGVIRGFYGDYCIIYTGPVQGKEDTMMLRLGTN